MKRSKWKRGTSAQSKRTKLKRWGPPGFRQFIESHRCVVHSQYCSGQIDCAHVVPRSRLGGWENNLVPLCRTHHAALDCSFNSDAEKFREIYGVDLHEQAKMFTRLYVTTAEKSGNQKGPGR